MSTRHIVVKTLLNADEFQALDDACKKSDTSHSKALRDLANGWVNGMRNGRNMERPGCGHKKGIPVPSRSSRPSSFRLRQ